MVAPTKRVAPECTYYSRVFVLGGLAGMHLAVMDMFKVAFQTFLKDLGVIRSSADTDIVLTEYSKMYSVSALLDVACTLFWGHFTDTYGTKLSLNIQALATAAIFFLLSQCTDYSSFFLLMVASTLFDKYVIALDTFLSWVPAEKKLSYLSIFQMTKSIMMQSGPFLGGALVSLSQRHILVYFGILCATMLSLTLGFNVVFWNHWSEKSHIIRAGFKEADDEASIHPDFSPPANPEEQPVPEVHDEEVNPLKRDSRATGDRPLDTKKPEVTLITAVDSKPPVGDIRAESFDVNCLSFRETLMIIWKDQTARHLILLGLYLRMAKKYLDYGFHLWAEISPAENGLGVPKLHLGVLSTAGGISSVLLFFFVFSSVKQEQLPKLILRSFLLLSLTILMFPFLVLLSGPMLYLGVLVAVLSFMLNEQVIFTCWVVLLNTCLPKSVLARTYAISLAIKGLVGSFCSFLIFKLFRWTLESPSVSALLRPLNSLLFFWTFAFASLFMFWFYRRIDVHSPAPGVTLLKF